MPGSWIVRLALVSMLILPGPLSAQTATSGTIAGVVRDTSGAVVPGVTVEASSPALIEKVRTVVTDDQGRYAVVDLRPGTYTVTFTLQGFNTVRRQGLDVTTGFTSTLNAELRVGAVEESVTVTGASPVVDVENVRQQTVLTREVVDTLPTFRAWRGFAAITVGASLGGVGTQQDVGGNMGEKVVGFSIHGGRPGDMMMMQEGMTISWTGGQSRIFFPNEVGIQETTLETTGMSAESMTGGIQINIVPKDGGNTFSVYTNNSYSNGDLQSSNLTDDLRARGMLTEPAKVRKIYDYGVGVGGPIMKDRLWFYSAHRWWGAQSGAAGNYYNLNQNRFVGAADSGVTIYEPDLSQPAYSDNRNRDHSARLTWQAAPKHKFAANYSFQDNCDCFADLGSRPGVSPPGVSRQAPEADSSRGFGPQNHLQVVWTYPATNRVLFDAGVTYMREHSNVWSGAENTMAVPGHIAIVELSRGLLYNSLATQGLTPGGINITIRQWAQRFAASYVTGSHALKGGVSLLQANNKWNKGLAGPTNGLLYTLRGGVPLSLTQYASPFFSDTSIWPQVGLFAQDQWRVRNLTLNLGARFDSFNGYANAVHIPAGPIVGARDYPGTSNSPNWKDVTPRLGASYDLFGNGKTAIKGSIGRYVAFEGVTGLNRSTAPSGQIIDQATRTWTDSNGDYVPNCDLRSTTANDECGPLSNTRFGTVSPTTLYAADVVTDHRPYTWEGSVALQHEVRPGVGLTVGYYRTWYGNFRATDNQAVTPADYDPFCVAAPVDPRLPGGGGNPLCGLADVTPAKFGRVDNLVTQMSRFGKQTEVYNGIDVTMNARFGKGALLQGGVSTGQTVVDNCVVVDSPQQQRPGFCRTINPWRGQTQVKMSGVYPLPWWGLQTSATFQNLPGASVSALRPYTNAEVAPSLGRNLAAGPNGVVLVDLIPPYSKFEDRLTQVDLRFTKMVRVGRARVQGRFDIYNLLNANTVLAVNGVYGPAWTTPTLILAGRIFKFGAQVDF